MAKLTVGVGEDFPVEEKPRAETRDCSWRGYHHDHHHHLHHHHLHHHKQALREMWHRHFGRRAATDQKKVKE